MFKKLLFSLAALVLFSLNVSASGEREVLWQSETDDGILPKDWDPVYSLDPDEARIIEAGDFIVITVAGVTEGGWPQVGIKDNTTGGWMPLKSEYAGADTFPKEVKFPVMCNMAESFYKNGISFLGAGAYVTKVEREKGSIEIDSNTVWFGPQTISWWPGISVSKDAFANIGEYDSIEVDLDLAEVEGFNFNFDFGDHASFNVNDRWSVAKDFISYSKDEKTNIGTATFKFIPALHNIHKEWTEGEGDDKVNKEGDFDIFEQIKKNGLYINGPACINQIRIVPLPFKVSPYAVFVGPKQCDWGDVAVISKDVFADVSVGDKIQIELAEGNTFSILFGDWSNPSIPWDKQDGIITRSADGKTATLTLTEESDNLTVGDNTLDVFSLLKDNGFWVQGPVLVNQVLYIPVGSEPDDPEPDPEPADPNSITADWWHQWDGFGADAQIIDNPTKGWVSNIGKDLNGDFIIGNSDCDGDCYADLTNYAGIEGVATPGTGVRFYINRTAVQGGSAIDITVNADEDGKYSLLFKNLKDGDNNPPSFVHLVFVKIKSNGVSNPKVESMKVIAKPDPIVEAKENLQDVIDHAKLYDSFAKTAESFAALQSKIGAAETAMNAGDATVESLAAAGDAITEAIEGLKLEEGYENLTADMFKEYTSYEEPGEGKDTNGAYVLFESTNNPYGTGGSDNNRWADVSAYDKLIVTISGNDKPRVWINRKVENGVDGNSIEDSNMLDMQAGNGKWSTNKYTTFDSDNNVFTVDLNKIKADYDGVARLHGIKYSLGVNGILTGMYLYKSDDPLEIPKEQLAKEIENAKNCDSHLKSEESWTALQEAIAAAESELTNKKATADSLTKAKENLIAAIEGLTPEDGYAVLTREMFKSHESLENPVETGSAGCEYNVSTDTGSPYGDVNVSELNWADLTDYDKLIIETVGDTKPRIMFNRLVKGGNQAATQEESKMIDINPNTADTWSNDAYQTIDGNTYTIDLRKIVDDYGFARLHSIKKQGWGPDIFVTGMYLYKDPKAAKEFNISFDIDNPTHIVVKVNDEEIKDLVAGNNDVMVADRAKLSISPAENFILTSVIADDEEVALTDGSYTKTIVKAINYQIITADANPLAPQIKELNALIESAKLYDGTAKTEESYAVLAKAIEDAETAVADKSATEASLKEAAENITNAIDALKLEEGYKYLYEVEFKKYASVAEPGDGENADCEYVLFKATETPYGNAYTSELQWSDLYDYDKLIITTVGNTKPRIMLNRLVANGNLAETPEESKIIEINPNGDANNNWAVYNWATDKYLTTDGNTYTIDLSKIAEDYGFVRLHSIKKQGWAEDVFITGMYLYKLESIALDKTEIKELTVGKTVKLTPTVTPDDPINPQIVWSSSEEKVATVSEDGVVTAINAGQAIITATCGKLTASCTVICYAPLADTDGDGEITVNDAIDIANYIVGEGKAPEYWDDAIHGSWDKFYLKAADVNGDGTVSVSDASATVQLALTHEKETAEEGAQKIAAYNADMLVIGGVNVDNSVAVTLDNATPYVALQADIYVADGVNFEVKAGSRIADSHSFQYHRFDANHVRIAIYNFGGRTFADNDEALFEIVADSQLTDSGDIRVLNVLASDADAKAYRLGASYDDTTGAALVGNDTDAPVKVYDLNGRYVSDKAEGLAKGIYIIRQGDNVKKVNIR